MKKLFLKLVNIVDRILSFRYRTVEFYEGYLEDLQSIEADLRRQKETPIYTTVRGLSSADDQVRFWAWAKSLITTDEYAFMIFELRENTIREMVGITDTAQILRLSSRMDMLQIIDRYLHEGVKANEAEKRRIVEANSEG